MIKKWIEFGCLQKIKKLKWPDGKEVKKKARNEVINVKELMVKLEKTERDVGGASGKLEKQKQEDIYTNYWYPMEKSFGHSENSKLFDRFMRDYLPIKIGKIPTLREIYSEFKIYS